jgi:hypothetical protein
MTNPTRKKKPVAYVVGPYRDARGAWYVQQNIQRAAKLAAYLWTCGYAVICPHTNTAHFDGVVSDDDFLLGLLDIMERCDLVVTLDDISESQGSLQEVRIARELGIPVFWESEVPIASEFVIKP